MSRDARHLDAGHENLAINNTRIRRFLTLVALKTTARFFRRQGACVPISRRLIVKSDAFVDLTEGATMRFIADNTSVPIPKVWCSFVRNGRVYLVMERIRGDCIAKGWDDRSKESKDKLLAQLKLMVEEIRSLQPRPDAGVESCVGGSLFDSRMPRPDRRFGPFQSIQEFHLWLRDNLRPSEAEKPEQAAEQDWKDVKDMAARQDGPWPRPVFTHGDLNPCNIIVRGDKVVGIIDWEFSDIENRVAGSAQQLLGAIPRGVGDGKDSAEVVGRDLSKCATGVLRTDAKQADTNTQAPPHVLEKGVLYYFIRGRVGIDEPKSIDDIARGYLILRPIPDDAKLHGALPTSATARLIALPKKALPAGPKDRFMAFVEKSHASYDELGEKFLKGGVYETKTAGRRQSPDATPVGEGVYVLTTTGRESHLSYMATLPQELGELQMRCDSTTREVSPSVAGIRRTRARRLHSCHRTQSILSREVLDKFGDLRQVGAQPEFMNYPRAQILLIGHKTGLGEEDKKVEDGEDPVKTLGQLEKDDLDRMQHLSPDESDAIYADLHSRKMAHPEIQSDLGG
ncbi:protein kinase subdomain-containing protein, partial [Metarhizium brunneum ARSEF 3297]